MSETLRAVLWDMDGTLVDTEPYWMIAEAALVESFGGTWTDEQAVQLVGNGLLDSARVLQEAGVDMEANEIVNRLTDDVKALLQTQGVPFRPGAPELLRELRERGIPTALVTMSLGSMARAVVELMDFTAFDVVVAGDDVSNAKPHPEAYLLAAKHLGIDVQDAVVIEDSAPGLTAGVASGAVALGVPHIVAIDHVEGAAALWDTLQGRTVDDLLALFVSTRSGNTV